MAYMAKLQDNHMEYEEIPDLLKNFYGPMTVSYTHLQPLVRASYQDPVYTYATNVMGKVNLLECARHSAGLRSLLNVTTDKVYENKEWEYGYRETDRLDGYDPYSNLSLIHI